MGNRWMGILSLVGVAALAACSPADHLPEPPENYLLVDTAEMATAFAEEDEMRWGLYGENSGPYRIEGVVAEAERLDTGRWRIGLDTAPLAIKLDVEEVPAGLEDAVSSGQTVAAFCDGVGLGPVNGKLLVSDCRLDRAFFDVAN